MSLTADAAEQPVPQAPVLPLSTTIGHLIRRAQQVHTALWGREFGGDLTGPQYALLSALTRHSALDQRTAGRLASLDKSTAADVVARLQRSGWLVRERHPQDARRYVMALTAPAKTALPQITPRVAEVQRQLIEPLSEPDRALFIETLARVAYAGEPPTAASEAGQALALSTTPGHLIRRSEQLHGAHWARRVGTVLTPPQYGLLSAVAWNRSIDQSTAGELASLDKSSTTDIIARLTRRGLVTSVSDDQDRRRKFVVLTEDALAILEQVTPDVELVQRDVVAPLDEAGVRALVELLQTVAYR